MFKDDFRTFRNKVQQYSDKFDTMTEEATKNAIIMPFLVLLGYDVFDPEEIIPEYTCDVAGKKGEKIDYVILHDGEYLSKPSAPDLNSRNSSKDSSTVIFQRTAAVLQF